MAKVILLVAAFSMTYAHHMPDNTPAPNTGFSTLLPLGALLKAIGDQTRWRILRLLAEGEPLMVTEVARAVGLNDSAAAKQLAVLRRAGVVQTGRGRLQQLSKGVLLDKQARTLDLGFLLLRLGVEQP